MSDKVFLDTNVLVYAIFGNGLKQQIAESLLMEGGNISVQAINELCNVCRKKFKLGWSEIGDITEKISKLLTVHPIGVEENSGAQFTAQEYGFSFYDSLIFASAIRNGGDTLYSEDMQDGQVVETLTIYNPFNLVEHV